MKTVRFPFIHMPEEFLTLLKSNISVTTSSSPVFDVIRPNRALYLTLEKAFQDLDDGRGLEKTMMGLGWPNFRERVASLYIYKSMNGEYPKKTQMDLIEDLKQFEAKYQNHSVHGTARVFLLGFYLRLANIEIQNRDNNQFLELKIPEEISGILKLSQGRTEKIDWLILITTHLYNALGEKLLTNSLASGKKLEELYQMMPVDRRDEMHSNLLSYGASIQEPDMFVYEKI
jgi:hypothetical protein